MVHAMHDEKKGGGRSNQVDKHKENYAKGWEEGNLALVIGQK